MFLGRTLIQGSPRDLSVFLLLLPLAFSAVMHSGCRSHTTVPDETTTGKILASAESTFLAMKERDYPGIWTRLSATSRDTIVDDTLKAIARGGGGLAPRESIERDFREGGPVSRSYWEGLLRRFDPDTALKESRWEMGEVTESQAIVLITSKKAQKPAVVILLREDGTWKMGLVESFWHQPAR